MDSLFSKKIQQLASDLGVLDNEQAVELLDNRLEQEGDSELRQIMNIERAKLLAKLGRDREAIALLDSCAQSTGADEGPAYFAAEIFVQLQRYAGAEEFLKRAERRMEEIGSTYYGNCIHLLYAYCAAKQGKFDQATQMLGKLFDVDGDEEIFWLPVRPVISISTVQELIARGLPKT